MRQLILALAAVWWSQWAFAQAAPDLKEAEALVRSGKAAQALQLLHPHEDARAGTIAFDYLLGIAFLEAGRADRATIALERALIVNPNHAGARLDLARAYFALGDMARARTEFNIVLAQNPPDSARATIQAYLARIDQGGVPGGTRATGYLEVTAGRDSNANNATGQGQIYVPVFGFNLQLAPTSQRTSDNFLSLGGGGELTHALNEKTSLYAGADARFRLHHHRAEAFDNTQFDARGGVQHALDAQNVIRFGAAYQQYYLDTAYYRSTWALNGEWRHMFSSTQQLSVFGIYNRVRYQDDAQIANDTNLSLLGAGWTQVLDQSRRFVVSASGFGGYERDVGQRIDGDRKLVGARAGGQIGWGDHREVFATTGVQWSGFQSKNLLFNEQRTDKQFDAALGVVWRIDRDWQLKPQLTYARNWSNIDINSYSRYEVSATLRRDFK